MDIPSLLISILSGIWLLVKTWWWLILPCLFYFPAKTLYFWWLNWEIWYKFNEWMMLEIIPPGEVLKPFLAMEDFFTAVWPIIDSPNWREAWCEGMMDIGPYWVSFEIVSLGGEVHFYLRILKDERKFFETAIHTHYPDAEIVEAEDYTQKIPKDIPNEKFNLYGEDFYLKKEDVYPIKTYKFFEIRPEEITQEKKLDPFSALMEAMTKLKKGEQVWFQIVIAPISNNDIPWVTMGREVADKLARREGKSKLASIVGEAVRLLAFAKPPYEEEKKEEPVIPPEMKLTPMEREVLGAVEEKISKYGFKTFLRSVYIAERDVYFSPHGKIPRSYLTHFSTQNLNELRYWGRTRTRIHYFFRKRRLYARQKMMLRKYIERFPPLYPKRTGPGNLIFNAEELATIFHFPMKAALLPPGVPRVAAKKGVPPVALPTEE